MSAVVRYFLSGALSVGGLLLATGVGIGYTALLATVEAAAISNLVSPHYIELVQSGDYLQLLNCITGSEGPSAALQAATEASNAAAAAASESDAASK